MSRKDAVVLASRTLALLFTVWALAEASYLPEFVHSLRHYIIGATSSTTVEYLRHYYLMRTGFLATRMVGYFLIARWLYKGGPEVEELLSGAPKEASVQN
jgi:hypothetical protein